MANIKDIFQAAANYAGIRMLYGTPEQIEDEHRRTRQADNAKPYPIVMVFEQQPPEVSRFYKVYSNYIILFAARIVDEKINSKNEVVFEGLEHYKEQLIEGLCKSYGVTGIFPSAYTHTSERKLLKMSTDKICGLEVNFNEIQIIKNC